MCGLGRVVVKVKVKGIDQTFVIAPQEAQSCCRSAQVLVHGMHQAGLNVLVNCSQPGDSWASGYLLWSAGIRSAAAVMWW